MTEKVLNKNRNGMAMLLLLIAVTVLGLGLFVTSIAVTGWMVIPGLLGLAAAVVALVCLGGLKVLKPQEALVLTLFGNSISLTQFDLAREGIGAAAAIIVSLILQFFWLSLDFKKVEVLEFEDDKYYYHVKAVPKITAEDFAETAEADGESVNFEQKLEDSLRNL